MTNSFPIVGRWQVASLCSLLWNSLPLSKDWCEIVHTCNYLFTLVFCLRIRSIPHLPVSSWVGVWRDLTVYLKWVLEWLFFAAVFHLEFSVTDGSCHLLWTWFSASELFYPEEIYIYRLPKLISVNVEKGLILMRKTKQKTRLQNLQNVFCHWSSINHALCACWGKQNENR